MRHGKRGKKFSRPKGGRAALMRNLSKQLFIHGRIMTTITKAKVLRGFVEPLITKAKRGTLHDIRQVSRMINNRDILKKLVKEVAPLYSARNGGYTRIIRHKNRPGDNAQLAIIELIDSEKVYKKEETKKPGAKKEKEAKEVKEVKEAKPKKEKEKKEEKKKPVKKAAKK
ncbi:MAG TPA: 50S ribosomal protein L17 [bacterium]|nr:50S ribosomal protein L17 [bacterium]